MLAKFGLIVSMALAAMADAILLPPQMADDFRGVESLTPPAQIDPSRRDVLLECPTCPRATMDGSFYKLAWAKSNGNSFLLSFELGPDSKTLLLDGVQIYPRSFESAASPPQFFDVTQYGPEDPLRLGVTGYTSFYPSTPVHHDSGFDLIPVTLIIEQIAYQSMRVPPLTIYLLQDADGHLMIASFKSDSSMQSEGQCNDWLSCKWKAAKDKFNSMASSMRHGCHKPKGSAAGQVTDGGDGHHHDGHHHHDGDHHHHDGHKHHKHHKHNKFLSWLYSKVDAIDRMGGWKFPFLLFLGFCFALTTCALAYVGFAAYMLYQGETWWNSVFWGWVMWNMPDENVLAGDEKQGYAVLPLYEEAPPEYEQGDVKVVVEEAH